MGSLPSERANSKARSKVSSEVTMVRTTSTSFITGTGLKKWRPTNWSGRLVNMAIWVMVSDEVLLAKMASGLHHLVEGAEGLPLLVQVLDDGLDHDVAVGQVGQVRPCPGGGPPPRRGAAASSLPFSTALPSEPWIF